MGSKVNNNESRQSSAKLVTDFEAPPRQPKIQRIPQHEETPRSKEMIPSISSHRCNSNSGNSPSSIKKGIRNQEQDSQPSPRRMSVDLSSLVQERNENKPVRLQYQDEAAYGYDETFASMIIDSVNDEEIESFAANDGCVDASFSSFFSTSYSPTNEQRIKPFCPNRMPQRSAMKGSNKAQVSPPLSKKRASIGALGETLEILLLGHSEPIERQRAISFDDRIDIQNIEPIRLLAIDGPQSLWYQEHEYETIKFKTLALLDRVDHNSGVIDGKKYCTRGLEKFMTPEATEVKKHQAWDSVLSEQFLQRKDGEFDEETLANIYRFSTIRSKLEAIKRAILDTEAAEAHLKTTFQSQSSSDGRNKKTNFNRRVSM